MNKIFDIHLIAVEPITIFINVPLQMINLVVHPSEPTFKTHYNPVQVREILSFFSDGT